MYLIIGLGNPGKKYEKTKHNVGFLVIDRLAEEFNIRVEKKQAQALTETVVWDGKKILLVKPQTYMNLSGQSVIQLINYYDNIENFIIVHDDLDMPVGKIRFRKNGSAGGHNGLRSIIKHLNSQDFERLKIGIGHPGNSRVVKDYVLRPFNKDEQQILEESIDKAVEGLKVWLQEDINAAMNKFN